MFQLSVTFNWRSRSISASIPKLNLADSLFGTENTHTHTHTHTHTGPESESDYNYYISSDRYVSFYEAKCWSTSKVLRSNTVLGIKGLPGIKSLPGLILAVKHTTLYTHNGLIRRYVFFLFFSVAYTPCPSLFCSENRSRSRCPFEETLPGNVLVHVPSMTLSMVKIIAFAQKVHQTS